MFNIKHILQGIENSVFVKEEVEKIAEERHSICKLCTFNSKVNPDKRWLRSDEHCTDCGCNLHLKTRSLSSDCPQGKWKAVATQEEAENIEQALNENSKS